MATRTALTGWATSEPQGGSSARSTAAALGRRYVRQCRAELHHAKSYVDDTLDLCDDLVAEQTRHTPGLLTHDHAGTGRHHLR